MKFLTEPIWYCPPHLRHVCCYKFSAVIEEYANKLHF